MNKYKKYNRTTTNHRVVFQSSKEIIKKIY